MMKTHSLLAIAAASLIGAADTTLARDPDSAEYYLAHAEEYVDKEVRLDVSHVSPVRFASPNPEVAFLHVITYDDVDRRHGGAILMILPAADKEDVIDDYGLNHRKGRDRRMDGVLRLVDAGPRHGRRYILDYEGRTWDLVKDDLGSLELPESPPTPGRPGRPR